MGEINYKFNFEGLQKGAQDANAAASAMQKLGIGVNQVSESFKKLNPHLFQQQRMMNMPPNWYVSQGQLFAKSMGQLAGAFPRMATNQMLSQGANQLLSMGRLPGGSNAAIFASNSFLTQGANRLLGMGPLFPSGMVSESILRSGAARALAMGPLFPQYSGPTPPKIGVNWAGAGLAAASAPFSPWLAARGLSNAFGQPLQRLFKSMGIESTGSGIFGGGGFIGFQAMFVGLNAAGKALQLTFENLSKAIQEGSKLFQSSARTGVNTGQLFQMKSALQVAGMNPEIVEQMIVRGQHMIPGRGGAMSFPGTNQMVGWASGMGMVSEAQEMKNLGPQLAQAWKDATLDARVMYDHVKDIYDVQFQINSVTREWRAMWVELVGDLAPVLKIAFEGIATTVAAITLNIRYWFDSMRMISGAIAGTITSTMALFQQGLGISTRDFLEAFKRGYDMMQVHPGQPGNSRVGSAFNTAADHAGWSRMGFVFRGGYGSHEYGREIAQNTRRMADLMFQTLQMNTGTNREGGMPIYNHA